MKLRDPDCDVPYAYDWLVAANAFNVDSFLAQPLTARVATNGPTVRPNLVPVGGRRVLERPARGPDCRPGSAQIRRSRSWSTCAIWATGAVRQVIARGTAENPALRRAARPPQADALPGRGRVEMG